MFTALEHSSWGIDVLCCVSMSKQLVRSQEEWRRYPKSAIPSSYTKQKFINQIKKFTIAVTSRKRSFKHFSKNISVVRLTVDVSKFDSIKNL